MVIESVSQRVSLSASGDGGGGSGGGGAAPGDSGERLSATGVDGGFAVVAVVFAAVLLLGGIAALLTARVRYPRPATGVVARSRAVADREGGADS